MQKHAITILIPVLQRPHRAQIVVDSIRQTSDCDILFICSPNDTEQINACKATGERIHIMDDSNGKGDYQKKINKGIQIAETNPVLMGADDLRFYIGWYEAARTYWQNGYHVIGTNDMHAPRVVRGEHSTHSIITKEYVNEYGLIDGTKGKALFEGYWHEWCDDELVGTAKKRGVWAFSSDSLVEHLHPNWGFDGNDYLYAMQLMRMRQSKDLYEERQKLWT